MAIIESPEVALVEQGNLPVFFDPDEDERERFLEFSRNFWNNYYETAIDHRYGTLTEVEGIPSELTTVDGFKRNMQSTTLSIDLSERMDGKFSWHVNSSSPGFRIDRRLSVDDQSLNGQVEYKFCQLDRHNFVDLDKLTIVSLIGVVHELAAKVRREKISRLPLQ